jgi:hypothetical protein
VAATPKHATFYFKGRQTGIDYAVDAYVSDVVGSMVTFDAGAGAGAASPNFYTFPEAVYLRDIAVVTGLADTTQIRIVAGGAPTPHVLAYATHLNTNVGRPKLAIPFKAGTRFMALQMA